MRAQLWRGSVFFLLMLTASLASFAQVDTARLQGTVTDPQGAAAVGATVAITSVETGRASSTITNDLGFYSTSALPPGRYRIHKASTGSSRLVQVSKNPFVATLEARLRCATQHRP